ncbi:MAG: tetrahydromethanopterin S-methyltransferase subunit F [Methanosphaera sp. SHI613]|jgi:tetrahydromethanopterin S-methyltransferase subunit F|nr:MAG: tetrahydromethanopterin S-methyltransferase subunit F [Methanosphaera sp. SHI613]
MKKNMENITDIINTVEYKTQLIGRNERLTSGIRETRLKGIVVGFIITCLVILLPIIYYKGGI